MSWLDRLAERMMLKARAEGRLSNLEGEGRPLPDRPEAPFISAGEAVGFRMMAEAGVVPEEIALKKQVQAQLDHLAAIIHPDERREAMRKLADLQMRQAMAEEARRAFFKK